MVTVGYIPDRGDIVWLEFAPQRGHEQTGNRPALVVSPSSYNRKSGLFVVFPITSQIKGYPFEVLVQTPLVSGAVLADQVKSLDWRSRNVEFICNAEPDVINESIALFSALISLDEQY
ncbi:MAG TPA: endoribonuclease MazF [Prolixibacteraceae bacterium]|nr:endoribonuclease MazF [Prolixibacteraceae bacterium]HPT30837.1 endoribonuclease MazF [Prolixibacteraceae bacterium]